MKSSGIPVQRKAQHFPIWSQTGIGGCSVSRPLSSEPLSTSCLAKHGAGSKPSWLSDNRSPRHSEYDQAGRERERIDDVHEGVECPFSGWLLRVSIDEQSKDIIINMPPAICVQFRALIPS